jgi:hypothetical protein
MRKRLAGFLNGQSENTQDQERRDMSNDNTRGDAEPSLASAGSHGSPVAWVAFAADASESRALFLTRDAAERAARKHGWFVAELFARPTLTDEERVAIDWAATIARQQSQVAIHKVFREMLVEHPHLKGKAERLRMEPSIPKEMTAWIPIKRRLPEEGLRVLWFSPGGKDEKAYQFAGCLDGWSVNWGGDLNLPLTRVTHWHPLPLNPREAGE